METPTKAKTRHQPQIRRKWSLEGRFSTVIVSVVVVSFLTVSLVYACSGGDLMRLAHLTSPLAEDMVHKGPCSETTKDICKAVRKRTLSLNASPPQAKVFSYAFHPILTLVTDHLDFGSLSGAFYRRNVTFPPVIKRPLFISNSVLRI